MMSLDEKLIRSQNGSYISTVFYLLLSICQDFEIVLLFFITHLLGNDCVICNVSSTKK